MTLGEMTMDELYHHGIKGQKWGLRRYQNLDGSLTPAGKEHYGVNSNRRYSRKEIKEAKEWKKAEKMLDGLKGDANTAVWLNNFHKNTRGIGEIIGGTAVNSAAIYYLASAGAPMVGSTLAILNTVAVSMLMDNDAKNTRELNRKIQQQKMYKKATGRYYTNLE